MMTDREIRESKITMGLTVMILALGIIAVLRLMGVSPL